MKLKLALSFHPEESEYPNPLGEIDFIESKRTRLLTLEAPPTRFTLPDGSFVEVFASYSPSNTGTSIAACHGSKQIGLLISPWGKVNPYIGIQVADLGFLHIYGQKFDGDTTQTCLDGNQ